METLSNNQYGFQSLGHSALSQISASATAKIALRQIGDLSTLFSRARVKSNFDSFFQRLFNNEDVNHVEFESLLQETQ